MPGIVHKGPRSARAASLSRLPSTTVSRSRKTQVAPRGTSGISKIEILTGRPPCLKCSKLKSGAMGTCFAKGIARSVRSVRTIAPAHLSAHLSVELIRRLQSSSVYLSPQIIRTRNHRPSFSFVIPTIPRLGLHHTCQSFSLYKHMVAMQRWKRRAIFCIRITEFSDSSSRRVHPTGCRPPYFCAAFRSTQRPGEKPDKVLSPKSVRNQGPSVRLSDKAFVGAAKNPQVP